MKPAMQCVVGSVAIFLIIFAVYTPALENDFVNWDDDICVYENIHIRSLDAPSLYWMFTAFHASNWHPLTWVSHAVDYSMFGLNPLGHHLTSIILHGVNTFLVFLLIIQLMLKAKTMDKAPLPSMLSLSVWVQVLIAAGITALLFGVHPLHVESVAWVAERKDVLCAFFFLLTLLSYFFFASAADKKKRRAWFTACLVLSSSALMSKPMAVTLPLVLLLLDIYPLRRITLSTGNNLSLWVLLEKVPFLCLSFVSGVLTILAQHAGGAVVSLERLPLRFRLINALHSPLFYLTKMVWPRGLVPVYPFPKNIHVFDLKYIISGILFVSVTGVCLWLLRREKCMLFTVWAYYLITLMPVLGIIQVGSQTAADRYTYLPSISIFLLAGIVTSMVLARSTPIKKKILYGGLIVVPVFIVCGQLTIQQIKIWNDSETLWRYVINCFPGRVFIAHNNLGLVYDRRGMYDKAFKEYEKAVAIYPAFAEAHNNLGVAHTRKGMFDKAIEECEKAIAINPSFAEAQTSLGNVYLKKGMVDDAIAEYKKALTIKPDYAKAHCNLGAAYVSKKMYERAIISFTKAITLKPDYEEAYYNLGAAYANKGMIDEAIAHFKQAVGIKPGYMKAHYGLGMAFYSRGDFKSAIVHLDRAGELGYSVNPALMEALKPYRYP